MLNLAVTGSWLLEFQPQRVGVGSREKENVYGEGKWMQRKKNSDVIHSLGERASWHFTRGVEIRALADEKGR